MFASYAVQDDRKMVLKKQKECSGKGLVSRNWGIYCFFPSS